MFKSKLKTGPKFTDFIDKRNAEQNCGIFSPPITDREALFYLTNYLLGEDWYTVSPISHNQVNTEIVHEILLKYSPQYYREYKAYIKNK